LINGRSTDEIRDSLRFFIYNLNQSLSKKGSLVETSLGLEFAVPEFLKDKEAIGLNGKVLGSYADFEEESRLIASLLIEVMSRDGEQKPIFNPSLIIKIRSDVLKSEECNSLLLKSHRLVAESGTPYFVNLTSKDQPASYIATGGRLSTDWTGDWELDTLRTGVCGNVILNLPRVSYDSEKRKTRFFEILDERLEMAIRALEIKYRTIKQRTKEGLLPFLTQNIDGNQYFRLENTSRLVSFVGLNESVKSLSGRYINENEEALNLALEITEHLSRSIKRYTKKPETRLSLSMLPNANASKRLAELDVERYGWAEVHAQGTKEQPYYTDMVVAPLETNISWMERLSIEEKFHKLTPGSHLAIIQLNDLKRDPNELLSVTKHILKTHKIGLFAYNRNLVHCSNCQRTFQGILSKCVSCGSVDSLVSFSRMSAKYLPLSHWIPAKRLVLSERAAFTSISNYIDK